MASRPRPVVLLRRPSRKARGAVRLSVGFPTSLREIELAAAALIDAWRQTEK